MSGEMVLVVLYREHRNQTCTAPWPLFIGKATTGLSPDRLTFGGSGRIRTDNLRIFKNPR